MKQALLNEKPPQLKANQRLRRLITLTVTIGLSGLGGLSLLSLIANGFSLGWAIPIYRVIQQYEIVVETIRELSGPLLEPLFDALAGVLHFNFDLASHWPDIVLMMFIYLRARIGSYFGGKKYIRACVMFLVAISICLITSVFASSIPLAGAYQVAVSASILLAGFFAYDVIYAFVGASLDRGNRAWLMELWRHLSFSVPLLVGLLIVTLLLALITRGLGFTGYQSFVFIFCAHYCLISIYWAARAFRYAIAQENRRIGESVGERFWRSSATTVSLQVALALVVASVFFLASAGLVAVGLPFVGPS